MPQLAPLELRVLYVSVHAALEYDEVRLIESLGLPVDVGSADGSCLIPRSDRPCAGRLVGWDDETLSYYDLIIVMHDIDALSRIWNARRPGQRVIWRTIGQSSPHHERIVRRNCPGVEIIRYSPRERSLQDFAGESTLIRFYKDKDELCGWTGGDDSVMVMRNNFLKRGFVDDIVISKALADLPWKLFGFGNAEHPRAAGDVSYPELLQSMRRADVIFATHSVPASYTLNLMEAMMTGAPVVALAREAVGADADDPMLNGIGRRLYEVDGIIDNGRSGFLVRDADEARAVISRLLREPELKHKIGAAGRARAISLFDRSTIEPQWRKFLLGGRVADWRRSAGVWRAYAIADDLAELCKARLAGRAS